MLTVKRTPSIDCDAYMMSSGCIELAALDLNSPTCGSKNRGTFPGVIVDS